MVKRKSAILLYFGLILGLIISVFPFYWLAVMATRTTAEIYSFPPKFWFGTHLISNVTRVFDNVDFFGAFLNSLFVATCGTLLVLFFDSLAGFTFAKFNFPGKSGCSSSCSPR